MTAPSTAEGLADELRDQGYKITTPRFQVIEHVAGREQNFTAEELAGELSAIGRATVYRTIKLMLDQGILCRLIMGDGSVSYRMSHKAHHHHLVCVTCGATEDIDLGDVEAVMGHIRDASDYEVLSHRIEVYGFCPDCKQRQSVY